MKETVKNQININKVGKNSVIANGDNAVAVGKIEKNVNKKSFWASLIEAISGIFKVFCLIKGVCFGIG